MLYLIIGTSGCIPSSWSLTRYFGNIRTILRNLWLSQFNISKSHMGKFLSCVLVWVLQSTAPNPDTLPNPAILCHDGYILPTTGSEAACLWLHCWESQVWRVLWPSFCACGLLIGHGGRRMADQMCLWADPAGLSLCSYCSEGRRCTAHWRVSIPLMPAKNIWMPSIYWRDTVATVKIISLSWRMSPSS